jgi:Tfp pilus assembly protein PilX
MKNSRKTAGVTLVVTVLIVMLLLAGVVVVTGQLALASRRSSADQDATIQA